MSNKGSALMGIGMASGENRAAEAAKKAISSPLLKLATNLDDYFYRSTFPKITHENQKGWGFFYFDPNLFVC
jgi:hypothetical protein